MCGALLDRGGQAPERDDTCGPDKQREAEDLAHYLCQEGAGTAPKLPDPPSREQLIAAFRRADDRKDALDEFQKWEKLYEELFTIRKAK